MNNWFIYLVRTARGALYTGITRDVERRFAEHSAGGVKAAKALRGRGPLTLVFQQGLPDKSSALVAEARIKKWGKAKKEALVRGEIELQQAMTETA
ncbi:GIY-YIG nuclease family protein [Microbulbifer flavimaris]|uniref:GIY-YIG nuclease family protein n=1 Tax=Microbulbifer flavimaris TaxID=1781068 RepID=A0ABX4I1Y8_9GAMM|nr:MULTISPECIES: GIY-YIG nuclease family protein [Microbulbifer]KUJ84974.1 hypothetical protein AVO43_00780 [Microbulbifer sp. ZGT114]PCO06356.1 GIY-YIG nuclease family protein [Microbulbifer flavimaris]